MSSRLRLVLALHNHQPIGNFDGVCEAACADSYVPFLETLRDFPHIPVVLHLSGSLLEWLMKHRRKYVEEVQALVERGQIEIIGGPYYEPILASIPRHDRIGQIVTYSRKLQSLFGHRVRGMWVPERVWEQSFTKDIVEAGIEYTILDDYHFRNAGYRDEELNGYFLTEDEGYLLKLFPGSERLRYTIPFADPQQTIDHLREIHARCPHGVVTFGDDGEKFGTWPGTRDHVYQNGWLRRFLEALAHNESWLMVTTLAETVDYSAPVGRCYIPDSSYREMTEWALTTDRQREFHDLQKHLQGHSEWSRIQPYLRGGFWRNFRVKYPEANEMYSRMLTVSRKLREAETLADGPDAAAQLESARSDLYRAQCNCSYWHGAFGGLYLPHLRNAVFRHLILAENRLLELSGPGDADVEIESADFNLDARKELRMSGDRLVAWVAPSRGGHLYELDVRRISHNLLATLNRRPEPYHETVRNAAHHAQHHHEGHDSAVSIHDLVRFKQAHLDQKLQYDGWPRKSLVDHFLQPGLDLAAFQQGHGEFSDFVTGVYETRLRRSSRRVEAHLTRDGRLGPYLIRLTKILALDAGAPGNLEIVYQLDNLPADIPIHFGVEFNFAGLAAGAPDRYFYDERGRQLGPLESVQSLERTRRIGLVDEWLGIDVSVESTEPAAFWTFPIQTVSQSESGFELVHQSSVVLPHWEFTLERPGTWSTRLTLSTDTSASDARILRDRQSVNSLR